MNETRALLRHAIATVAYRGGKAVRNAPPDFGTFCAGPTSRSAGDILAHIGDLYDWALHLARGQHIWNDAPVQSWDKDVERFFRVIAAFDAYIGSDQPLECSLERLLQGPIADSLTHIGQIALLRRLAGAPLRGESYFKADIVVGRVGPVQTAAGLEFD